MSMAASFSAQARAVRSELERSSLNRPFPLFIAHVFWVPQLQVLGPRQSIIVLSSQLFSASGTCFITAHLRTVTVLNTPHSHGTVIRRTYHTAPIV